MVVLRVKSLVPVPGLNRSGRTRRERLAVTHAVFRARRGEHVYLPEAQADRLVLRALSGDGERTRLEIELPFAGGRAQAALNRTTSGAKPPRMQWTLEWTRRTRARRGR